MSDGPVITTELTQDIRLVVNDRLHFWEMYGDKDNYLRRDELRRLKRIKSWLGNLAIDEQDAPLRELV